MMKNAQLKKLFTPDEFAGWIADNVTTSLILSGDTSWTHDDVLSSVYECFGDKINNKEEANEQEIREIAVKVFNMCEEIRLGIRKPKGAKG